MKIRTRIQFVKRKYWWEYPLMVLQGLGAILDGLVMILSLGVFVSGFAIDICAFRTRLFLKVLKKEHNKS